jgi:hypothetical protein
MRRLTGRADDRGVPNHAFRHQLYGQHAASVGRHTSSRQTCGLQPAEAVTRLRKHQCPNEVRAGAEVMVVLAG